MSFGKELVESAEEALAIAKGEAMPAQAFVPVAELPGAADRQLGPLDDPSFIAKQVAILDARRRRGMNLIVLGEGGRILKIAPDGTETDVTAEAEREVERARAERST